MSVFIEKLIFNRKNYLVIFSEKFVLFRRRKPLTPLFEFQKFLPLLLQNALRKGKR